MPTTFVKGDLLEETPEVDGTRVLAFGADVSGSMDAGIAVAVKKRWPALAGWWTERTSGGRVQLGDAPAWREDGTVVYALGLQRRGGRVKVSWLDRALRAMIAHAAANGISRIAVARLWAGATKLDGDRAKRVLIEVGESSPVTLVVFEQFIRARPGSESEATEAAEQEPTVKKSAPATRKRAGAKRSTPGRTAAKKPAAKEATPKRAVAKKSAPRKAAAKKTIARKKTAR